jgi:hypothetical protein
VTPSHVSDRLSAFADRELDPVETTEVEVHLGTCASCRRDWDRHQFAGNVLRQMTPVAAPPHIWESIEAALDGRAAPAGRGSRWRVRPSYALAAGLVMMIAAAAGVWWLERRPAPWDVVRLDQTSAQGTRLSVGEWIETGANATARIGIGQIGTVELQPHTRMRLLAARDNEHRLQLSEGRISAEILAPPRIFFVETPSSTVVDLGCAYTMDVDRDGVGMLRVTGGWASLEWDGRESFVPAGASCPTRPSAGPGTPLFDDASERMREALLEFDFGTNAVGSLDVILSEARDRDTLTLWHLMSRVAPADRLRVFERLVALTPLPPGIDRDKAISLDPDTMARWRGELAWTW